MRRLHLQLAKEIGLPLLATLALLLQLLFAMQLLRGADLVFASSTTGRDLAKMAWLLAPHFLCLAMPIAFLAGALVGLGRLAEDRELLAAAAAGLDPLWLLPVPLAIAAVLAAAGLVLGQGVEPHALAGVRSLAGEVLLRNLQAQVRPGVFSDDLTGLTVYAEQVDPVTHRWKHVMVHDDRDRAAPMLVLAQSGALHAAPDAPVSLELADGDVHRAVPGGEGYSLLHFERGRLEVGLGEAFFRKSSFRAASPELSVAELRQAAREAPTAARARELLTAAARRVALPLAPLAFALLAIPLGAGLRKGARTLGLTLAAASYGLYYVASRAGQQWGDAGALPPFLAAQLPNLLFAAAGLALIQASRKRA